MGRSAFRPSTNLNHFYPVAERAQAHKSRSTGFGSEQPEFAARNTATLKSVQRKRQNHKSNWVKVLKVLRKLFQKFSKQGSGQSPEVLGFGAEPEVLGLGTESQGLRVLGRAPRS